MDISETVLRVVERETGHIASLDTRLDDLDIDSLDFLDLMLAASVATDLDFKQERMSEIETVGDIVRVLG